MKLLFFFPILVVAILADSLPEANSSGLRSISRSLPYSNNGFVSVIDTHTNEIVKSIRVGKYPNCLVKTSDNSKVIVTNRNSDTVTIIDAATNTVSATVDVGQMPFGLAVSPDDTLLYVASPVHLMVKLPSLT